MFIYQYVSFSCQIIFHPDKKLQILKDLNEQGKTIVIATHDYPLIRRFPARIITVEEQKIFETVIIKKENK